LLSNLAIPAWYAVIFTGSATGEGGGEECQNHGLLAAETGQGDLSALGGRQYEVGRHVAFLQTGVGGWMFWARRLAANMPAANASSFFMFINITTLRQQLRYPKR
jgi:hypothetical protein